MPETNSITLVGNATRDPELRYLQSGTASATFGIAVNSRRKTAGGDYEDVASFFDIQAFGSLAENISQSVGKGTRLVVVGRLNQRSWETKDGAKRSTIEVTADAIGPDLRWATVDITRNERTAPSRSFSQHDEPPF